MKKTIRLLVAVLLAASLACACADKPAQPDAAANTARPAEATEAAAPTEETADTEAPAEETAAPTDTPEPTEEPPSVTEAPGSSRYLVSYIDAYVSFPEGYVLFDPYNLPTEEMCESIEFPYDALDEFIATRCTRSCVAFSGGTPYSESMQVKLYWTEAEPISGDSFADLSDDEFDAAARSLAEKNGAEGYESVEGNGLRYAALSFEAGSAHCVSYITVTNGGTYTIRASSLEEITPAQRAEIEYMALSMKLKG